MPTNYVVTATALNLRVAPDNGSTILAVMRLGQICVASGSTTGSWRQVAFGLQTGYVASAYVRAIAGSDSTNASPPMSPHLTGLIDTTTGTPVALPQDSQTRLRGLDQLHPTFRQSLTQLLDKAAADGLPFKVFEAFRTPERQRWLYEQGRVRPGSVVTKAQPWGSFHQYGLAADLVLFINGQWTWSDQGSLGSYWRRLPQLASEVGLRTLDWEAPHVEWPIQLQEATGTEMLASADEGWTDTLASASSRWRSAGESGGPDIQLAQRPNLPPNVT